MYAKRNINWQQVIIKSYVLIKLKLFKIYIRFLFLFTRSAHIVIIVHIFMSIMNVCHINYIRIIVGIYRILRLAVYVFNILSVLTSSILTYCQVDYNAEKYFRPFQTHIDRLFDALSLQISYLCNCGDIQPIMTINEIINAFDNASIGHLKISENTACKYISTYF